MLRELRIIGRYNTRTIHGRRYSGWQMASHGFWAESSGGICDFRHWVEFEEKHQQCMGNAKCESHQQILGRNVGANVGANVGDIDQNVGANVGGHTDVIDPKFESGMELQTASAG